MRSISRRRSLPTATALTMALIGWMAVAAPASDASDAATAAPRGRAHDITLVTGDVVHYTDLPGRQDVVTVDPADENGRGVQVRTQGDDTYVVPVEAMPLLAAGKLDPRLFDVTQLVAMGYDDARTGGVPLIASAPATSRSARPPAAPKGAEPVRTLASIDATALRADKDEARTFWKDIAPGKAPKSLDGGIGKLWLDGRVKASLADETAQIKATDAWRKGFDGKGVKVAVLDTGADLDHPDLAGQVEESKSFVAGQDVDDGNGHGTHTASTIAGTGAASDGKEKGAAPGARLLVGKVLSDAGTGQDSDSIAGMEWAKAQGADVVSMSLGSPDGSDGEDPMSQAVNALSADDGPLYVIAAGNAYDPGTIGTPGAAASALTVGAVDGGDERASFSSQGPLTGTHSLKPDVSAPGVDVTAAASQSVPGWTGGPYRTMSGTSMATPLVAGAAAILKQRHPDWSGERVKDALMSTSDSTGGSPYEMGSGRVDAAAAVDATIGATGSVAAATYDWPNADAKATTRTVTYRNDGDADVSLALSLDTDDDAYALSASKVSVPARGTAEVTLSLDPSKVPPGTTFSGHVLATASEADTVVARTAFALFKEAEMYDYTVKVTGRDGKPLADTVALYSTAEQDPTYINVDADGEATLRLPPGRYTASSYVDVPGGSDGSLGEALLISDEVTLGAAHPRGTAALDARRARKAYAVPERESETIQTVFNVQRRYGSSSEHGWSSSVLLAGKYDSLYLTPTKKVADGTLKAFAHWRMREEAFDAETGTGRDITLTAQPKTAFRDGVRALKTVYAGRGAAADYVDLDAKGKAVIVDRDDAVTASARAQAAADAGAAMLIVVNDAPGRLFQSYSGAAGLSVASVEQGDGARLIAEAKSGRGTLKVRAKEYPDYTYDLAKTFDGGIPDTSLAYAPKNRDLARVDNSIYAQPGTLGTGGRYFVPSWSPALGGDTYDKFGRTTTEYVSGGTGATGPWFEQHTGLGAAAGYFERGQTSSYTAGKRYDTGWFKPVQAPRFGGTYTAYQNSSDLFQWNTAIWSGSEDGHTGAGGGAKQTTLYRGDTQVAGFNAQSGRAANMTAGSYKLVATGQRDTAAWTTSTKTATTWGFDYKPLPSGTGRADLPLLNLSYEVDTDLRGGARAGKRLGLGLRSAAYTGGVSASSATLQVSYDDGASWRDASLKRTGDGHWTTVLSTPRDAGSVSLRATAKAPGGLTVEQEVTRAVALN
ncbi:S8 family serine peptidase [Streptomyces sp. NPDC102340]|uniref:S8 family serine peptidase n=1 Tax=unclassified Streptomyces TaxID=2593676 RepID=UPI0037F413CD